MKQKRAWHGCFTSKNNIYVVGGWAGTRLSSTEVLNINSLTWTDGPDLPNALYGNSVVESVEIEYLGFSMGGSLQHETPTNDIFGLRESSSSSIWEKIGTMNLPREKFAAVNAPKSLVPSC